VVGRRALLAAGGAAVLAAGCGKDDTGPPSASEALLRSLAAERALAASLAALGMHRLAARSRRRATRLAAAVSATGGRPHDAPARAADGGERREAQRRGRAVLEAHVTALPSLTDHALRGLGGDVLAGAAGDVALLDRALAVPPDDPFPGTPR
jgi:hypothetical protein